MEHNHMNTINPEKALAALVGIVAAAIVAYLPELQDAQTELINLISAVTIMMVSGVSLDKLAIIADRYAAFAAKTPSKNDDVVATAFKEFTHGLAGAGSLGKTLTLTVGELPRDVAAAVNEGNKKEEG
jgi:CHASE1-domain containing sensor protein